jgi:hypothetical protein
MLGGAHLHTAAKCFEYLARQPYSIPALGSTLVVTVCKGGIHRGCHGSWNIPRLRKKEAMWDRRHDPPLEDRWHFAFLASIKGQ